MKLKVVEYAEEGASWLDYKSEYDKCSNENPIIKLEAIADMCDQNAESRNNHDFVGVHRILSALLFKRLGRKQATDIMIEVAEFGGLDAMCGRGTDELTDSQNAFNELGIKRPFHQWALPE